MEKIEVKDDDGETVSVGNERFQCAEILFDPKLGGLEIDGIDKVAFDTIEKCDSRLHQDMWSNIVISGGNSMLSGFCERLEDSLRRDGIQFVCPDDRSNRVWRGGSILAQSPLFEQLCITKEEYEECGAHYAAARFY